MSNEKKQANNKIIFWASVCGGLAIIFTQTGKAIDILAEWKGIPVRVAHAEEEQDQIKDWIKEQQIIQQQQQKINDYYYRQEQEKPPIISQDGKWWWDSNLEKWRSIREMRP